MDTRKQKLIDELKKENPRFEEQGLSALEHDVAIVYLETGRTNEAPDEIALLDTYMNDYEATLIDYEVYSLCLEKLVKVVKRIHNMNFIIGMIWNTGKKSFQCLVNNCIVIQTP
jgi:hypothetical protein